MIASAVVSTAIIIRKMTTMTFKPGRIGDGAGIPDGIWYCDDPYCICSHAYSFVVARMVIKRFSMACPAAYLHRQYGLTVT